MSRKTIKATFILFALFLSALAFLAGCGGPQKGYSLRRDGDVVKLVDWTQTGGQIEGAMSAWDRKPDDKLGLTVFKFDGVLDGENVSLTLNTSWTSQEGLHELGETIKGTLRGNILTLPSVNGAGPIEFRRVSRDEYFDAYLKLHRVAAVKITAK
jgi:hypothetical protein